jgi:hypothetical protein
MFQEEQETKKELEQVYIPATEEDIVLLKRVRFPIAFKNTPHEICGMALRVGQVHIAGNKQSLYRLKLRKNFARRKTATLPTFFMLEHGVFVPYEEWRMPGARKGGHT